jgi:hypothetical protein
MAGLLWLIRYLHIAFACDTPILEALWITGSHPRRVCLGEQHGWSSDRWGPFQMV